MVVKMNTGKNILGILNYNENKVKEGIAKCIHENLYGLAPEKLSFNAKLNGLKNFIDRNKRATTKVVHISMSFHPEDKLTQQLLTDISTRYMEDIGFGDQPYLVYQHVDTHHPHIHIVTTNIRHDGSRIILFNIGRNQSEKARIFLEKEYALKKASGRNTSKTEVIKPADLQRISYGKSETKRSISNIVRTITKSYKYTSLPELSAILGLYNVMADRGAEGSAMRTRNGLLYRIIDTSGKKIGVPIKASTIYGKPTLKFLEKQFKLNAALRQPHKARLQQCIMVARSQSTLKGFIHSLSKENIRVVPRANPEGHIYGFTFVDHQTRTVFNGSDLGKSFGAKSILDGFAMEKSTTTPQIVMLESDTTSSTPDMIADLLEARQFDDFTSTDAATRKKKKRKRKSL